MNFLYDKERGYPSLKPTAELYSWAWLTAAININDATRDKNFVFIEFCLRGKKMHKMRMNENFLNIQFAPPFVMNNIANIAHFIYSIFIFIAHAIFSI